MRINDTEVCSQAHLASLLLSSGPTARFIVMRDSDSERQHEDAEETKPDNDKSVSHPSDFIECGYSLKVIYSSLLL